MILFVPGYDEATRANLAVGQHLVRAASLELLEAKATREALHAALQASEVPLFSLSHGRPEHLCAQGGTVAIGLLDLRHLGARAVYAFACHTASHLGEQASQRGAVWWGYTGAIQCPEDSAELLPLFVPIFQYIQGAFAGAHSAADREQILNYIKDLCRSAQDEVDARAEADEKLDVLEAYHCLLHIWDRLRIWAPGMEAPQCHPEARPPLVFFG